MEVNNDIIKCAKLMREEVELEDTIEDKIADFGIDFCWVGSSFNRKEATFTARLYDDVIHVNELKNLFETDDGVVSVNIETELEPEVTIFVDMEKL